MKNIYIYAIAGLLIIGFVFFLNNLDIPVVKNIKSRIGLEKQQSDLPTVKHGEIAIRDVALQDDFTGAKVEKSNLIQGCFGGKDCIPSIDKPNFQSASEATWLENDDVVFAINFKGIQRAYPQRILNWHEIVNDQFDDTPVAITFCPLCGSALAFERQVDGRITEFGVSGKLHNSDLVMYDRYEGNLWQQITGEAIVGPAARRDEVLVQIPIVTTKWQDWKLEHPQTQVLSRDTGSSRDYGAYPYGTYEQDDELYFGVEDLNKSLQIKTVVYGIEIGKLSKAYPDNLLSTKAITDTIGQTKIEIVKNQFGEVVVTNLDTSQKIIPIRLFWFAWASFHPQTELYQ